MGTNLNASWFKRFGNFLTKFDRNTRNLIKHPVETVFNHEHEEGITNGCNRSKRIIGIYVVPITDNFKFFNQDITDDLKQLYVKVNENCAEESDKYFEVVQVCYSVKLPSANSTADEDVKHEYENLITNVPWFALPYDDINKCVSIRLFIHLYFIQCDIELNTWGAEPTIVVLNEIMETFRPSELEHRRCIIFFKK